MMNGSNSLGYTQVTMDSGHDDVAEDAAAGPWAEVDGRVSVLGYWNDGDRGVLVWAFDGVRYFSRQRIDQPLRAGIDGQVQHIPGGFDPVTVATRVAGIDAVVTLWPSIDGGAHVDVFYVKPAARAGA